MTTHKEVTNKTQIIQNKMINTKQSLEKIVGLVKNGFTASRKEVTVGTIKPTSRECIFEEKGHGAYTCESGADIAATPDKIHSYREYRTSSGKYLFKESLPLKEETRWEGCRHCGSYVTYTSWPYSISKSAKPAIQELETVHTRLYGKLLWMPWSISRTQVKLPTERIDAIFGIYEEQYKKGLVPLAWGIK